MRGKAKELQQRSKHDGLCPTERGVNLLGFSTRELVDDILKTVEAYVSWFN